MVELLLIIPMNQLYIYSWFQSDWFRIIPGPLPLTSPLFRIWLYPYMMPTLLPLTSIFLNGKLFFVCTSLSVPIEGIANQLYFHYKRVSQKKRFSKFKKKVSYSEMIMISAPIRARKCNFVSL